MAKKQNWIVRVFDGSGKLYDYWEIKNRTEHEAHSEAENEIDRRSQHEDIGDWTLGIPRAKKKLKKVI